MVFAYIKRFIFMGIVLALLGLIYWHLTSQGLCVAVPRLSIKLSKLQVPGFSHLRNFAWTYRLTLAHILAILYGILVYRYLVGAMRFALTPSDEHADHSPFEKGLIYWLGLVLLVGDVFLFYLGISSREGSLWGEGNTLVQDALITAAYAAILVGVAHTEVKLEQACADAA